MAARLSVIMIMVAAWCASCAELSAVTFACDVKADCPAGDECTNGACAAP